MVSISSCNPSINLFAQEPCALLERRNEMLPSNNTRKPARQLCSLILAFVGLIGAATLLLGPARLVSAQGVAPNWSYAGSLSTARAGHTATLLQNGKVLVAGGIASSIFFSRIISNSAELYDPTTGGWSTTGNLNSARAYHTAALLANGKVLILGGLDGNGYSLNSAELYEPATGTWSYAGATTGTPPPPACGPYCTATLLPNGQVLFAGGSDGDGTPFSSAYLYDPATGILSSTGDLNVARYDHTATLLLNGKVLVAGGGIDGFPH